MNENHERYEYKRITQKFRFIIVITAIISFLAGFCTHTLIGVKRSEYDGLLLYYDSISEKINKIEEDISLIKNPITSDNTSVKSGDEENASSATENIADFVWVTKSGKKYHKEDCSSLKKNSERITLQQAKANGKEPCKVCYK